MHQYLLPFTTAGSYAPKPHLLAFFILQGVAICVCVVPFFCCYFPWNLSWFLSGTLCVPSQIRFSFISPNTTRSHEGAVRPTKTYRNGEPWCWGRFRCNIASYISLHLWHTIEKVFVIHYPPPPRLPAPLGQRAPWATTTPRSNRALCDATIVSTSALLPHILSNDHLLVKF